MHKNNKEHGIRSENQFIVCVEEGNEIVAACHTQRVLLHIALDASIQQNINGIPVQFKSGNK